MKTFETEKHNIPEGATHYWNETSEDLFAWWDDVNKLMLTPDRLNAWEHVCDISENEAAPIPQQEVKWDGEGLPPIGIKCEIKYQHSSPAHWREAKVFAYDGGVAAIWHLNDEWKHTTIEVDRYQFRKLESPEEKEKRERLEAAYDLYVTAQKAVNNVKIVTYEIFTLAESINLTYWLAIVDKTNYRKEQ